ncbi:MAG: serine protease [Bacteriovorax sp.]|nr:serine protease [Bacteriovorax sp.]
MKCLFAITFTVFCWSPYLKASTLNIGDKGIYGDDNRSLISELNKEDNKLQIENSRAILAQVPKWRVTHEDQKSISIKTRSLGSGMNFCADEKFSELPLTSSCSAFLVGPDLILTAGHCLKDKYECQNNYWILDYNDSSFFEGADGTIDFLKDNIVSCVQIISSSENPKLDYALVRISRKITDRFPLKIRRSGIVDSVDLLYVVGHPMGLPKILTDQAKIRDNSNTYSFITNADTFSGNSGSPVINAKTQVVEGILVRGGDDFKLDTDLGCNRSYHCLDNECKGETVQRSSVLPVKLIPKI